MISVKNISFEYKKNSPILRDVSFEAKKGDCVAILGNNGAGKSTLLKCMNKLLKAGGGSVEIHGKNIYDMSRKELATELAYVQQRSQAHRMTVFDTVLLGRKPYIRLAPDKKDYEETRQAIEKMGLREKELSFLDELSGGELQKVMIARSLAQNAEVLLLDEPTNNLDLKNQHDLMRLISKLSAEHGLLTIIVMHDINLALKYCNKILLMHGGCVYRYGGPEVITEEAISKVYGVKAEIIDLGNEKIVTVE